MFSEVEIISVRFIFARKVPQFHQQLLLISLKKKDENGVRILENRGALKHYLKRFKI